MTTSLKRQLTALAAPASSLSVPDRKRSSIIFSAKEAATYNNETYYEIGQEGLQELITINPETFSPYEGSILFNPASKTLERAVENRELNAKIDDEVDNFMLSLHPYFMNKAALKCMEWLIHRFHIERFNISSVLSCILPYSDTKNFVMVIQALSLGRFKESSMWDWLLPCALSGAPLKKSILFDNVNSNFIMWVFSNCEKLLKIHDGDIRCVRVFLGFMTITLVGILNKLKSDLLTRNSKKKKNGVIALNILNSQYRLLKQVEKTFSYDRKCYEEVLSMTLIILGMTGICCKEFSSLSTILAPGINNFNKIMKPNSKTGIEVYLLFNFIASNVDKKLSLPNYKSLKAYFLLFHEISQEWDITNLIRRLILDNITLLPPPRVFYLISLIDMDINSRCELLQDLYKSYCKTQKDQTSDAFLRRFERIYPAEFDKACSKDTSIAMEFAKQQSKKDAVLMSNHSNPSIRCKAVSKLLKLATSTKKKNKKLLKCKPDRNKYAKALVSRFEDDEHVVVYEFLRRKLKCLLQVFSVSTVVSGMFTILGHKRHPYKVKSLALKKLCISYTKLPANHKYDKKLLDLIIPLIFPRHKVQMRLAKIMFKSQLVNVHKLLKLFEITSVQSANNFRDLAKYSYSVLSSAHKNGRVCYDEFNFRLNSASQVVVACVMFPSLVLKNISGIHKMLKICSSFPVTEENFLDCLALAEKKGAVSTEIVLTALLSEATANKRSLDEVEAVLLFGWRLSLDSKYHDLLGCFLKEYFKKTFSNTFEFYTVWIQLFEKACFCPPNSPISSDLKDLYIYRYLQQFNSMIPHATLNFHFGTGYSKSKPKSLKNAVDLWQLTEMICSVCLTSTSQIIRTTALQCLHTIKNSSKVDYPVITSIVESEREIKLDFKYINEVFAEIVETHSASFLSLIVQMLENPEVQECRKVAFLPLCHTFGNQIFQNLRPTILEQLEQASCDSFKPTDTALELLQHYDGRFDEPLLKVALRNHTYGKIVLRKIDKSVFSSYSKIEKKKIFCMFIDVILTLSESSEIKTTIIKVMRKWAIESDIVKDEIQKALTPGNIDRCKHIVGNDKSGVLAVSKTREEVNTLWVTRTERILELIQGKKTVELRSLLIPILFKILKRCISMEDQSPLEYLKQLVLTSLTMCCENDTEQPNVSRTGTGFDVQTIIDCLRCSRNPQTHHHALILLNYAASRYHEQVLHGIMSLFTFMGNSILRQDDAYSTQLIQQTVSTIIPTLAKTDKNINYMNVSAGIFRVFSSAVQDIPVHRRVPVFTSLIQTLTPEKCMWQLCVILIDNALQRDRKRSNLSVDLELAVNLAWTFRADVVGCCVAQIYDYISDLPVYTLDNASDTLKQLKIKYGTMDRSILDFTRKESLRDIWIVLNYILELVSMICAKFAESRNDQVEFDTILEKCIKYSKVISGLTGDKIFRLISHKNLEVIEKLSAALDPIDFLEAVSLILVRDESSVKRKVLEMLNQRILHKVEWFGDPEGLINMVPVLCEILNCDPVSDETVTLLQTVYFTTKLIAKNFALRSSDVFMPVFHLALKHTFHENKLLAASALLCLSELFCIKSTLIPYINKLSSAILHGFQSISMFPWSSETKKGSEDQVEVHYTPADHLLCISTITCVKKFVDHFGSLAGMKFLKKVITSGLNLQTGLSTYEKTRQKGKVFDAKLKGFMKALPQKIPLRNLIAPLREVFRDLSQNTMGVMNLMIILKEALSATAKPDLISILPSITEAFLGDFFCYRFKANNFNCNSSDILSVEDCTIDCFITGVVFKLSENQFRPIYHKAYNWAVEDTTKLVTFFRFSAAAAERLKSLFVTFAGHVINKATENLSAEAELCRSVLRFMRHVFANDKEGFVTSDRFNAIAQPVVNLLESSFVLSQEINIELVNDTIIQLAVATNDLNKWQNLIDIISLKANHKNKTVRLNILTTLECIATELSKDFLPLLPPAVPFLADLMNDDDEDVEAATHKLLLKLEEIVGEPLQPFFTTQ